MSHWIPVTSGGEASYLANWSPDGKRLFFWSSRDRFDCLWVQSLDSRTKRPVGPAPAVQHFHNARLRISAEFGTPPWAVSADRIFFTLGEMTSNIWMTQLAPR
jgi:hypothetical protein